MFTLQVTEYLLRDEFIQNPAIDLRQTERFLFFILFYDPFFDDDKSIRALLNAFLC